MKLQWTAVALTIFLSLPLVSVSAQVTVRLGQTGWEDSSVMVLISRYPNNPEWLRSLLRQETKSQSRVRLDSLADSMVALAIRRAQNGAEGERVAENLIRVLSNAGLPNDEHGVTYPGSQDRLIRIYRELPEGDELRVRVVTAMFFPTEAANEFLYQVATSKDHAAGQAMTTLTSLLEPGTDRYRMGTPAERSRVAAKLRPLAVRAMREETADRNLPLPVPGTIRVAKRADQLVVPSVPNADARESLFALAGTLGWGLSRSQ